MEIDKHRAVLYCGFQRCRDVLPALKESTDYDTTYYPLWMGNWLTDMNQATAFFSVVSALDVERWGVAEYWIVFLKKIHGIFKDEWLKRYIGKREAALKRRQLDSGQEQPDHYQSRSDGAYVVPEFIMNDAAFRKTWENLFDSLWKEEWTSAEGALDLSRKMGEIQELSIKAPLDAAGEAAVTTGEATEIGAYYPFDHFDVTDQYITENDKRTLNNREDLEVKGHEERGFMSATAQEAFDYALNDWLRKAFDATQDNNAAQTQQNRLADYQALKTLGHGIHTLQDFYSHSNYTDLLLICMAQRNLLDPYWNRRIQHLVDNTDVGTFNAFVLCKDKDQPDDTTGKGDRTPVVTGRFDTIDTVHTLLHLARESLLSSEEEPPHTADANKDARKDAHKEEKYDALYRILFGTFSDIDVVKRFKRTVETYLSFSGYIDDVQEKISDFFMENLVDPVVKTILKEDKRLIDTYVLLKDATVDNKKSIRNYRKAGELLFHQHTIEDHLRKEVATAEEKGRIILPHHALLAKDHDKNNDAVKLSYKLSCSLAAEVTTEVLVKYFEGAEFSEVEPLLRRRYVHPQFHVETCRESDSLNKAVDALDRKWFRYALKNPQDRRSILGFELEYL